MTMNHWEAADLAKVVPLARGWERQLDQKANPIFYDDEQLTASRYHDWLRENAVRWVALPNAPLDYSARPRRSCSSAGPKFLELVYESPRWRIWEVRDTDPPASGGAKLLAAGPNWFMVDAAKPTVVRYRYTPYWSTTNACVSRAPGGWTRVEPEAAGRVMVQARFGLERRPPRKGLLAAVERSGRPASLWRRWCHVLLPRGARDLLWQIVLFCGAYWLYRLVRGQVFDQSAAAFDHARDIVDARAGAARVRRAVAPAVGDRAPAGSTTSAPGCT